MLFDQNFPQNGGYMWVQAAQPMTCWQTSKQRVEKQRQGAEAQLTSSARRNRRQRQEKRTQREGNAEAAMKSQLENRLGGPAKVQGQLSSAGSEDGSSTHCSKNSWADALEDEFAASPEQLPASWGEFRDECLSQSSQPDIETEVPSNFIHQGIISRRVRAAAAKDWGPVSGQGAGATDKNFPGEKAAADDSYCPEAAVDPILLVLEDTDSESFRSTLDEVVSSVWWLAWTKRGSRIVQKAIEVGTDEDQKQILGQLRGRVLEALKSPHANHVLQKCIEVMSPDQLQFAMAEIQVELSFTARHRFGCRILQRLIEHGHPSQTEGLISELVSDTSRLCRHQFGNFAIQHILQHGTAPQRSAIATMLGGDTIRLAKHRIASYVISCALSHCATEDVQMLTQVVLHDAGQLADLSRRQYGSFVVREVNKAVARIDAK